ncbi:MAG: Ig-like domain-containing protein [Pirellulales bacterium]
MIRFSLASSFARRTQGKSPRPKEGPASRRRLAAERLESRRLLTTAAVTPLFRDDDFTITGTFAYNLVQTEYRDSIPNGQYTGSGHIYWESPTKGQATLQGVATGAGSDRVLVAGSFRNCSSYNIRDEGSLSLQLDAGANAITVDSADATSTTYTSYTDLTGGFCAADTPNSVFFGGLPSKYGGSFNASTFKAAVTYTDPSVGVTVASPAATVNWSTTTATDFALSVGVTNGAPVIPENWSEVSQSPTTPDDAFLDAQGGRLDILVEMTGKPVNAPAAGPNTPVGTVALAWASNNTNSATLQTITIDSTDAPVALYWNSSMLFASITNLPTKPSWAQFVKVSVAASGFTESSTANNVAYVPIKTFEAQNGSTPNQSEDELLDGFSRSVLGPADVSRYPNVTVLAYNPESRLGASVFVTDDRGAFTYDPTFAPQLQALAQGETATDVIDFLAIENGAYSDFAEHQITVVGENDPPTPTDDDATTREDAVLFLTTAALVANDVDIDHGDSVHFSLVEDVSLYGAAVTLLPGGVIRYNPGESTFLRSMTNGETLLDSFAYRVVDDLGVEGWGLVNITVTGVNSPPEILPVSPIVLGPGETTGEALVQARDWESDPSSLSISISHAASPLLDPADVVVSGSGDLRTVTVTPNPGQSGRVRFTAQVTTAAPDSATASSDFYLIVGTASDTDLDGVPNSVESQAPQSGDADGGGVADALESNVASFKTTDNSQWLWINAPTTAALSNVAAQTPPTAAGAAVGATFPWGGAAMDILVTPGGQATLVLDSSSTATLNAYYQWKPSDNSWEWLGWNGQTGALPFSDHVDLTVKDGGRGDADGAANGVIVVRAAPASVAAPWQNRSIAEDVNNDGLVSPRDALIVINFLNSDESKTLPTSLVTGQPPREFLDVFADNLVSPRDALIVINRLNGVSGEGAGEGEGGAPSPSDLRLQAADAAFAQYAAETDSTTTRHARHRRTGF